MFNRMVSNVRIVFTFFVQLEISLEQLITSAFKSFISQLNVANSLEVCQCEDSGQEAPAGSQCGERIELRPGSYVAFLPCRIVQFRIRHDR